MDEELRFGNRNALCGIIYLAHELASSDFQHRVWINAKGPEVSSYREALNGIFDDYHAEDFLAGGTLSYGFSALANQRLEVFVRTLDEFDKVLTKGLDDMEILRMPGWESVKKSAAEFLDSSVGWLEQNCSEFPMMKWTWAGRLFGSEDWSKPEHPSTGSG